MDMFSHESAPLPHLHSPWGTRSAAYEQVRRSRPREVAIVHRICSCSCQPWVGRMGHFPADSGTDDIAITPACPRTESTIFVKQQLHLVQSRSEYIWQWRKAHRNTRRTSVRERPSKNWGIETESEEIKKEIEYDCVRCRRGWRLTCTCEAFVPELCSVSRDYTTRQADFLFRAVLDS